MEELENNASLKGNSAPQQIDSVSVQTDEIFLCHKCSFEGEDIYDLEAHTYSEHSTGEYLTCLEIDR